MSGHSKWSTIKHKKAALDAKRGKAWGKLSRAVTIAARKGGGDPSANPTLRLAVEKAKAANMPKDTIEKAIKKGTGELEGETYEEIVYEGYGPGGVAIMCNVVTDNRNRTAPEVKKLLERFGGNLGAPNCVAWMFSMKGIFAISTENAEEEKVLEVALENGLTTVAFPAISCGVYGYPIEDAARIAVDTVARFVEENEGIELVRFVLFTPDVYAAFETALANQAP